MTGSQQKLRTVRVPDEFTSLFAKAEEVVSHYFHQRRDDPEQGTIEVFGERYLLVRAASLSVEFFSLVRELFGRDRREEADDFARNLLFDLAHAVGRSDALKFHQRMKLEDPIERLAAGPVHFSHTGWAFVDIKPESNPSPDENYYLLYDHPYSFEADAWVTSGQAAEFPVCIMNSGYSSGWCQESFGVQLVASEVLCRARGDSTCRFIMAHPDRIEVFLERYVADIPKLTHHDKHYKVPDFFSRKRMEDELRRARDELEQRVAQRTAELEHTNELLRQEIEARKKAEKMLLQTAKLEVIGRLAGGIAHDFNNLMGVVIGHTSLLETRYDKEAPLRSHITKIRHAAEEAAQLTQQLLTFSRAQLPDLEVLDLNQVINETATMLERLIGENVELTLALSADTGAVIADTGQLRQVIMNLVVNARDAMPQGGTLRIQTAAVQHDDGFPESHHGILNRQWCLLAVSDTGNGMTEETLQNAFEPFYTTKPLGSGTGLGLSTAHRIVTQFGGTIDVSSRLGEGTTFRIYLPQAKEQIARFEQVDQDRPMPGGVETILVVEDQPAVRQMVVEILGELGYTVLDAGDPEGALALAASTDSPIQLLLTDVVMPQMSGRALADRLLSNRPDLKVLFMSGYADDDVLRFGVVQGTAELMTKPFTSEVLAERVRQALDD